MGKIIGFNEKEQRIFNKLKDGTPRDFRDLKKLFWEEAKVRCKEVYEPGWGEHEINSQAQSFARNHIRRLIRDGWVEQTGRGTYSLTRVGKNRVEKGTDTTPSALTSQRGRHSHGEKKTDASKAKKTVKVAKSKKADPKKLAAMKSKVTKEAKKAQVEAKAKKTAIKADKENGHKTKIKNTVARATEQTIEERLAAF